MKVTEQLEKKAEELTKKFYGENATPKQYNQILSAVASGAEIAIEQAKKTACFNPVIDASKKETK